MVSIYADDDNNWKDELMNRVVDNRKQYCQRHGYEFINANALIDHSRPVAWSKLIAVEKTLQQCDYVVYVDMDVIIMRPEIPLQAFINHAPPYADFIMSNDWSGPNTGVWIARKSVFSTWFLKTAFEQKQLLLPYASNGYKHPFEYEQRAFHYLMNTKLWRTRHLPRYNGEFADEVASHFYLYPQCAFNSYIVHPFEFRANRQISQVILVSLIRIDCEIHVFCSMYPVTLLSTSQGRRAKSSRI